VVHRKGGSALMRGRDRVNEVGLMACAKVAVPAR